MTNRFPVGSVATLYFDLIASGEGQTGQSPMVALLRRTDRRWYNAATGAFQEAYVENAMRELDPVNLPGRYAFEFDHAKDELVSMGFLAKKTNAGALSALEYEEIAFGPLPGVTRPH